MPPSKGFGVEDHLVVTFPETMEKLLANKPISGAKIKQAMKEMTILFMADRCIEEVFQFHRLRCPRDIADAMIRWLYL